MPSQFTGDTLGKLMESVYEIRTQMAITNVLHEKNTVDLARCTSDLEKHIQRTNLLQEQVADLQSVNRWWTITARILVVLVPIAILVTNIILSSNRGV